MSALEQPFIGRKGDIGVIVEQDNAAKNMQVIGVQGGDELVQHVTGYRAFEMNGLGFDRLVDSDIQEAIDDYVEYELGGADLVDVLRRIRNFTIRSKDGRLLEMAVRVQHGVSASENPVFIVVMSEKTGVQDECVRQLRALQSSLSVDPVMHVFDHAAYIRQATEVTKHVKQGIFAASMAVIRVDGFEKLASTYSEDAKADMMRECVQRIRKALRETDVLAYLGDGAFGVVLLKANQSDAGIPLNRIRNDFSNTPLSVSGQVSTITACSKALQEKQNIELALNQLGEALYQHPQPNAYFEG